MDGRDVPLLVVSCPAERGRERSELIYFRFELSALEGVNHLDADAPEMDYLSWQLVPLFPQAASLLSGTSVSQAQEGSCSVPMPWHGPSCPILLSRLDRQLPAALPDTCPARLASEQRGWEWMSRSTPRPGAPSVHLALPDCQSLITLG